MGGGGEGSVDDGTHSDDGDGVKVNVNVRCSNGSKFTVQINLESTVGSFKEVLSSKCDIPADQQRLIYKGRILKDDQTVQSYGLEADHTVHLVRGFAPPASANPAGATNAGAANSTQARGIGSNDGGTLGGSGFGASPFPGLGLNGMGGTGGLFGAGLPDFEQVQQQLTQSPSVMRDIMNTPAVQNLMNNPDIMRNLIMNNPQMREIIDRNPELAHVLNDPGTLRQTLEAARNPELMREMMRNTDRAMSNIEATPEGFNMLRRMYENVQEPFMNATTMAGNAGSDGSNPFASLLGAQGGNQTRSDSMNGSPAPNTNPLPNPWSSTGTGVAETNTTASNPISDARPQTPTPIAGLNFPEFEALGALPQDYNSMNQFMQNPAVSQIMQSLISNPQYMNQILGSNPQFRSMLDSNSHLREMMQNPEFLRQLASPETMQLLLTVQQSLMSQFGRQQQQSTQETGQTGGTAGSFNNTGLEILMNMFGGLGTGSLAVPNRPDVPPEELYAAQLSQLQEMGFFDQQENIRALMATAGNVHAAVERLLGNSGL
ncbi:hypothetical protein GBA52_025944 [Prunus armeniaca]|nr:hypothetical protein GBA52_025944 [Prunus armeniaca]